MLDVDHELNTSGAVKIGDHRRPAFRRLTIALLVVGSWGPARADPGTPAWYDGQAGHKRLLHLAITGAVGLAWIVSEAALKPTLAASECRWCSPPGFDASVRNAVVWGNTARANLLSNFNVYVLSPVVGFGLLIVSDHDAGWARLLDDTIPIAESIVIGQSLTQIIKFSVGRQRPYAHYGPQGQTTGSDDNTSFTSGHSALGFSITASAGMICHWRHYRIEPYVWGAGIALSLSTEYLRMGADKHYLSDVVIGGAVGFATGMIVPRMMREDIKIVPIPNGAAIAGTF